MVRHYLIADRDPHIRHLCRRFLRARGHEAEIAATGLECMIQLREKSPAILVLDPELPWGGGAGVLEVLWDEQPVRSPIVLLTMNSNQDQQTPMASSRGSIAASLPRPRNLCELMTFVDQMEAAADLSDVVENDSNSPRSGPWK